MLNNCFSPEKRLRTSNSHSRIFCERSLWVVLYNYTKMSNIPAEIWLKDRALLRLEKRNALTIEVYIVILPIKIIYKSIIYRPHIQPIFENGQQKSSRLFACIRASQELMEFQKCCDMNSIKSISTATKAFRWQLHFLRAHRLHNTCLGYSRAI